MQENYIMVNHLSIAILFWEGYLEVSPTVISIIDYFSEHNCNIDLFLRSKKNYNNTNIIQKYRNTGVAVFEIPTTIHRNSAWELLRRALGLLHRKTIMTNRIYQHMIKQIDEGRQLKEFKIFGHAVKKKSKNKYDVCFAIDPTGLLALKYGDIHADKIVNVSLEIWDSLKKHQGGVYRLIKRNELNYLKHKITFSTIQDEYRWNVYKKKNHIEKNNVCFLPNSCRKPKATISKENYFREKYNIEPSEYIVLSAGMICDNVHSMDLARAIGDFVFKHKIKFIFHERFHRNLNDPYLKKILEISNGKILLSLEPVEYKELHKLSSSADIGLVIYNQNIDDNYRVIGATSGKMFQYISCGVPIIASSNPGLKEIVHQHEMGIVVESIQEIPAAIDTILDNYDYYSTHAIKAFNTTFDVDIHLSKLYDCITSPQKNFS